MPLDADIIGWIREQPLSEQPELNRIVVEEERIGIEKQKLRPGAGRAIASND